VLGADHRPHERTGHELGLPEVIAVAVEKGSRDYLDWMDEETKG